MRPTRSMKSSILPASRSAEVTSSLENLAVIDGFAIAGPFLEFRQIRHVRVVDLFGYRVLGDSLREDLGIGLAQRVDHSVRQRFRRDALVLDQVFNGLGVVLLAPRLADDVAGGAGVLDNRLEIGRQAVPLGLVDDEFARRRGLVPASGVVKLGRTMQTE